MYMMFLNSTCTLAMELSFAHAYVKKEPIPDKRPKYHKNQSQGMEISPKSKSGM